MINQLKNLFENPYKKQVERDFKAVERSFKKVENTLNIENKQLNAHLKILKRKIDSLEKREIKALKLQKSILTRLYNIIKSDQLEPMEKINGIVTTLQMFEG